MKLKKIITIASIIGCMEASAGLPAPIDGIGFKDWAAANAFMTRGMSKEKVANILGVSVSSWESTNKKWSQNLNKLMRKDFSIMNVYGEVLKHPNVGKFANISEDDSMKALLKKVPTYEKYTEILAYMDPIHKNKIDGYLQKLYGLSAQEWSQVSMYWSDYLKKKEWFNASHEEKMKHRKEIKEFEDYDRALSAKWREYFKTH